MPDVTLSCAAVVGSDAWRTARDAMRMDCLTRLAERMELPEPEDLLEDDCEGARYVRRWAAPALQVFALLCETERPPRYSFGSEALLPPYALHSAMIAWDRNEAAADRVDLAGVVVRCPDEATAGRFSRWLPEPGSARGITIETEGDE